MVNDMPFRERYKKYPTMTPIHHPNRRWPAHVLTKAPMWCSVDLRDGNQALIEPMGIERKMRMWNLLLKMGYKEIEVGFPSASATDYDFLRKLIEEDLIPSDVTIQVLTQARPHLISGTMQAIQGAKRVIVHLYNSTSPAQRKHVFDKDKAGIVEIAIQGAKQILEESAACEDIEIVHQYSPESFTQTEIEFAHEICSRVRDVYKPTKDKPLILNLPATVEVTTPNIYADSIEWFADHFDGREEVVISLHTHNDRGCGVAATELGLLAGADRVEGTLLGNGERTGNVDLVTLGLNLMAQGVNPGIDFSNLKEIVDVCTYCNRLPVSPRHPYVGELVYTAFSGSHQDAIHKAMHAFYAGKDKKWDIPYLLIDPQDVGLNYEAIVRINSQSGKGGVAFVMEKDYGFRLPRGLQMDFSNVVQKLVDEEEREMTSIELHKLFQETYMDRESPFRYIEHRSVHLDDENWKVWVNFEYSGTPETYEGTGTGPINVFFQALRSRSNRDLHLVDYMEHSVGEGDDTVAAAYVELEENSATKPHYFGVGVDRNSVKASLKAVASAMNRTLNL